MPKGYPLTACKICGKPVENRSELTIRGKHLECSAAKQREEIQQLVAHRGPHFEYWRRRCREAFRDAPLDAPQV